MPCLDNLPGFLGSSLGDFLLEIFGHSGILLYGGGINCGISTVGHMQKRKCGIWISQVSSAKRETDLISSDEAKLLADAGEFTSTRWDISGSRGRGPACRGGRWWIFRLFDESEHSSCPGNYCWLTKGKIYLFITLHVSNYELPQSTSFAIPRIFIDKIQLVDCCKRADDCCPEDLTWMQGISKESYDPEFLWQPTTGHLPSCLPS